MESRARILIVSTRRRIAPELHVLLQKWALAFDFAPDAESAARLIRQGVYDLIVSESDRPCEATLAMLQEMETQHPPVPILLITPAGGDAPAGQRAQGRLALVQGLVCDMVKQTSAGEAAGCDQQTDGAILTCFDGMIGRSQVMQDIYRTIQEVAKSEANVLITGESGTGKELVARSIHGRSARRRNAFVPINCSAFPEHLFEAELFGYEKGAFTGANQKKIGLLEYAHGGTFFLDEVCEMPVNLQAKLLRVLQDGQLRHLGGNRLIPVDVRLVSASNRNLEQALTEGRLREDFYFRLNVVNIHLPALRDRREDIPLLAYHFLEKYLQTSNKKIRGFDDAVMTLFDTYSWPGNVRELENVIERAITLATRPIITLEDLPPPLHRARALGRRNTTKMTLPEAKQQAVFETERKYLLHLLVRCRGNVSRVAREAGMSRRNVHRLLKRHKLNPLEWRRRT